MSRLYYEEEDLDRLYYDEGPFYCKVNPNWFEKLLYSIENLIFYYD